MRSDIARWITECCVKEFGAVAKASELFESFQTWARGQGMYGGTICAWGIEMGECPGLTKCKRGGLIFYKNIRLKSSTAKPQYRRAFDGWLRSQSQRNDAVGDLAADVVSDSALKGRRFSYETLMDHLLDRRACLDALIALRQAHQEFRRATR
jgi:hypothetical protein